MDGLAPPTIRRSPIPRRRRRMGDVPQSGLPAVDDHAPDARASHGNVFRAYLKSARRS